VINTAAFSRVVEEKVIGVEMFQFGCVMEPTLDKRLSDLMLIVSRSPARPTVDLMLQTNGTLLHRLAPRMNRVAQLGEHLNVSN
jgi:hypothetical protein